MLTDQEAEEFRIRQLVEKWALTRNAGDWDRFASRLPGLRGPEVERLYQEGRDWRAGSAAPGRPGADGLLSPAG